MYGFWFLDDILSCSIRELGYILSVLMMNPLPLPSSLEPDVNCGPESINLTLIDALHAMHIRSFRALRTVRGNGFNPFPFDSIDR
jgi:hypothetical protein